MALDKVSTEIETVAALTARLDESISSITFVGLLFTVSLAVLAVSINSLKSEPIVAVPLFLSIIACFYGSIAYAVVAGQVRSGDAESALRSIGVGNVLSEWYGIYMMITAFAPVIGLVSHSTMLCVGALIANLLGYAVYAVTPSLSMMSRFAKGGRGYLAHGSFVALVAAGGIGAASRSMATVDAAILTTLVWCFAMSLWHWITGEGESLKGTRLWRFQRASSRAS